MKVTGTSVLHGTPEQVWAAINDPAVLAGVIPGCDRLTELGDGHFGMTVTLGVAAIKGSYSGEVRLYDRTAPAALTMRATGAGGPGTIDTTVAVTLADAGDGTTRLDYDADAVIGGMVGGVGQRVLTGVAKKTAGLFFSAIDDVLTGKKPAGKKSPELSAVRARLAASDRAPGTDVAQPDFFVPGKVGRLSLANQRYLPIAGGAVFGALSMLVGVLVGARIGGGRDRRP